MSTKLPLVCEDANLSHAWGRALLHVLDTSTRNLAPLVVSVNHFDSGLPVEDAEIRVALDAKLEKNAKTYPSKISALTIFPYDAWVRRNRPGVTAFAKWYLDEFLPRLKARDHHNSHGTYFERMVNFQGSKMAGKELGLMAKNQLEHIVNIWKRDAAKGRRPRRSALQIAIFDPAKDHTGGALLGFPCLQQVSLAYDAASDGLAINAYYPTQYIMDRGYGNYLGLCHLGHFMAREMGLQLSRLNCFIGLPELGSDWNKGDLKSLADLVRKKLSPDAPATLPTHAG